MDPRVALVNSIKGNVVMNLQISFIGILIISVFYALSAGILLPLWRCLRPIWLKWTVVAPLALLLLALPWAEEAWIAWHFNELCKGAGVNVTRKVEVEGFYDDMGGGPSTAAVFANPQAIEAYEKLGFRFKESKIGYGREGKVSRVEKSEGQWKITILDRPTARYRYQRTYRPTPYQFEEPMGWKLEKSEEIVVDSETGEIIGRDTRFKRYPSVVEALWIHFLGSGITQCPDPGKGPQREHLPDAALSPIQKKQ